MAVAMVAQAGRGRLLTSMAPRRTLRAKRQSRRAPPPQARYDLSGPKAQEAFQPSASAASPPPALSSAPLLPPPPMRGVARGGPPPAAMMKPPQGSEASGNVPVPSLLQFMMLGGGIALGSIFASVLIGGVASMEPASREGARATRRERRPHVLAARPSRSFDRAIPSMHGWLQ